MKCRQLLESSLKPLLFTSVSSFKEYKSWIYMNGVHGECLEMWLGFLCGGLSHACG